MGAPEQHFPLVATPLPDASTLGWSVHEALRRLRRRSRGRSTFPQRQTPWRKRGGLALGIGQLAASPSGGSIPRPLLQRPQSLLMTVSSGVDCRSAAVCVSSRTKGLRTRGPQLSWAIKTIKPVLHQGFDISKENHRPRLSERSGHLQMVRGTIQ